MSENSNEPSRETFSRAKPVAGGKETCARCDESHAPGSAYCRAHRNEYQREWAARQRQELRELREMKLETFTPTN